MLQNLNNLLISIKSSAEVPCRQRRPP